MRADLLQLGELIDENALFVDRHEQLTQGEVLVGLALPGKVGVKQLQRLGIVHRFVVQTDQVGLGLCGFVVVNAVDLLEVRGGDLLHVFGKLDAGDDLALFVLDGADLVHAAEDGVGLRGDQTLADAKAVNPCALHDEIADDVLVERVGGDDLTVGPSRRVEHLARLLREVGDIARVETDRAIRDAEGLQHLVEGADRVRHAALQHVIGIDEQSRRGRIQFAVGAEGLVFVAEHLNPGVRHRARCGNAVDLVGNRAGGGRASADIRGARTEDRGVSALCASRAEFADRAAVCGTDDARGLRRDERLVVQNEQEIGLDELRLDRVAAHRNERLTRENDGSLGNCPHITREAEGAEIIEKFLREAVFGAEIGDIVLVKVQIVHVFDDLLEACRDGVAALIGILAEKYVEINDLILHARAEIAVAHRQLVKIKQHGEIP